MHGVEAYSGFGAPTDETARRAAVERAVSTSSNHADLTSSREHREPRDIPRRSVGYPTRPGDESDSTDSDEEDDVPLGRIHPHAAAEQQARLAAKAKRREARRAEREAARHAASAAAQASEPRDQVPHHREYHPAGEGVSAEHLATKLERLSSRLQPPGAETGPSRSEGPSRSTSFRRPDERRSASGPARSISLRRPGEHHNHSTVPPPLPTHTGGGSVPQAVTRSPNRQIPPTLDPERRRDELLPPPQAGSQGSEPVSRSATVHRNGSRHEAKPHSSHHNPDSPRSPHNGRLAQPESRTSPSTNPTTMSRARSLSARQSGAVARQEHTEPLPTPSSRNLAPSSSAAVSRSRSLSARHSSATTTQHTEPLPQAPPRARPVPIRCFIAAPGGAAAPPKAVTVDVYPETTARDILQTVRARGNIPELVTGATSGWVVCEVYSEQNLERQVREYEPILSVVRGWDSTSASAPGPGEGKANCLIVRESARAIACWSRGAPKTAPFVAGPIHLETKKGKWIKRWMATRGGQVFISKNDKGKEEVQVNTMFSDVYTMRQPYKAPMPYVFALKRLEPASSFENKAEHLYMIAADDTTGWKLTSAAFDSRSYTMAENNPAIRDPRASSAAVIAAPSHGAFSNPATLLGASTRAQQQARQPAPGKPLVDLNAGARAFTGAGLLGRK